MPCYHPVPAVQNGAGSRVVLNPPAGTANMSVPCGTCVGCRTIRAVEWSRRCMHEAAEYDHNSFVTLTYDDDNVPRDNELRPRDLVLFIKRLREAYARWPDAPSCGRVAYFASGEYGDVGGRPHYHALLFNVGFPDRLKIKTDLYESEFLSKLWRFGSASVGDVTARSANYVAQYSMKKLGARLHCDENGVVRRAPFLRMSRRPAIGFRWLERYCSDLEGGFLVTDGRKGPIPRAYKKRLDGDVVAAYEAVLAAERRRYPSDKHSPARLADGEVIALQRVDSHSL